MSDDLKPNIRFRGFTENWKKYKLSRLATMHARIGWQNLRTSEFLDSGEYMLITGTDFVDGRINFSTCHYVEKERYDQDKNIQISNGSILITKDGTLGKVAYVQELTKPATLNAGVFNVGIIDKNQTDNRFLFEYLKAPFLMNYVVQKATGGTIKHINQCILVEFPIIAPNKSEQEKIGELFFKLDDLIMINRKKCNKLKSLKKSLLVKMFPNNKIDIPSVRFKDFNENWKYKELNEVVEITSGQNTGNDINGKYYNLTMGSVDIDGNLLYSLRTNNYDKLLTKGTLIMPTRDVGAGYVIGRTAVIDNNNKYYAGNCLYCLKPYEDDPYYIHYYMNSELARKSIQSIIAGGSQKQITLPGIKSISIPICKTNEQIMIAKIFNNLDKLITLYEFKYDKLNKIKQSLLNDMFV